VDQLAGDAEEGRFEDVSMRCWFWTIRLRLCV
jgi:hypothetical protein